ncbi:MAG: hypothetical protein ACMXYC_00630 [Candidatus Woesearchaeota archaeon]
MCLLSIPFVSIPFVFAEISFLSSDVTLNTEQITGIMCKQDTQYHQHVLYCLDNFNQVELVTHQWNGSCSLSLIDLDAFECNRPSLQVLYDKQGEQQKLVEPFFTHKVLVAPERIIQTQKWDGGWDTPSDTAYGVWILSQFNERFAQEIFYGLEWLKEHRNEEEKCWQVDGSGCHLYETARTLGFLSLAGINHTVRTYHDGVVWLERQQNYIVPQREWDVSFRVNRDAQCTLQYNNQNLFDGIIQRDDIKSYTITPEYGHRFVFWCDNSSVRMEMRDHAGMHIVSRSFSESQRIDYVLPDEEPLDDSYENKSVFRISQPCWGQQRWTTCSTKVSLYALLSELEEEQKDKGLEWLEDQLEFHPIRGKFLSTDEAIFDSALYLYALDKENKDVAQWLIYTQNNDGSWGSGSVQKRVAPTVMAILALQQQDFSTYEEALHDARLWMSIHYPLFGWDHVKDDALSFMILKDNARPFLRLASQDIIRITQTQESHILINPTKFALTNISVNVSGTIKDKINVQLPSSMQEYSNTSLSLRVTDSSAGYYHGFIEIVEDEDILLIIPVVYEQEVVIDATVQETYYVHDQQGILFVDVARVNAPFSCVLNFEETQVRFSLEKQGTMPVMLYDVSLFTRDMQGELVCTYRSETFVQEVQMQKSELRQAPLLIDTRRIAIVDVEDDYVFSITNQWDFPVDVSIRIEPDDGYFLISQQDITLDGQQEITIPLVVTVQPEENVTYVGGISLQTDFSEHYIDVVIGRQPSYMWLWIVLLFLTVSIGFGGYYVKKHPDILHHKKKKELIQKASVKQQIHDTITHWYEIIKPKLPKKIAQKLPLTQKEKDAIAQKEAKDSEERNYFEEIVGIMKSMDKTDLEIKERLHSEGLDEQQIEKVLESYEASDKIYKAIDHEEKVLHLLKDIGSETSDVFKKLKNMGYSDEELREATKELSEAVNIKEAELKKQAGIEEEDVEEVDVSKMK